MGRSAGPGAAVHCANSRTRGLDALHSYRLCRNFIRSSSGAEALEFDVGRLKPGERLLLHLQVGLDVAVRRVRALVAEPQGDHVERHAALQQVHGGRMPQGVRRDALGLQTRLLDRRPGPPQAPVAAPRCIASSDARIDWAAMPPIRAGCGLA
jgi:hypothetical protein